MTPHRHYCTYFDHRYLPTGLALHASLLRVGGEFTLWVLALDDACARFLDAAALPGLRVVRLDELERFDPELQATRPMRSTVEYYFTCSPCLPRFLLTTHGMDAITYLDSDLSFHASPEPLFDELQGRSVLITPHRFARGAALTHARYGKYNVGWLTFRADGDGMRCLDWWRDRCIEWCHDRVEPTRYADQKYLDEFEHRFDGVRSLGHPGANLAPWNVGAHHVALLDGRVTVDGQPLVFFHFQGLRQVSARIWDSNLTSYGARLTDALRDGVFRPYIGDLHAARKVVAERMAVHDGPNLRRADLPKARLLVSRTWRTLRARLAGNLFEA